MSKILVIPDTHLKPKVFDLADKIMHEHEVDYAVQLGDNFDDFYCFELEYKTHYARMEQFAKDSNTFPQILDCSIINKAKTMK